MGDNNGGYLTEGQEPSGCPAGRTGVGRRTVLGGALQRQQSDGVDRVDPARRMDEPGSAGQQGELGRLLLRWQGVEVAGPASA